MTAAAPAIPHTFNSMLCLRGQGVVKGYAIGRAAVMGAAALEVVHYRIQPEAVEEECARLKAALAQARDELQHMVANLPDDAPREMGALLTVHSMLLDDRMLSEQACNLIIERHYNAEWALTTQGQALGEQFAAMEDEYLRERGTDIRQVIERVLRVLSGTPVALPQFDSGYSGYSGELIVVARDISPRAYLAYRDCCPQHECAGCCRHGQYSHPGARWRPAHCRWHEWGGVG